MPARIVKQPNGLWARFSTVVDSFTHMNMDDAKAREVLVEGPFKRATPKQVDETMARAVNDAVDGKVDKDDGLNRWRDSLADIEMRYGKAEMMRIVEIDKNKTEYN